MSPCLAQLPEAAGVSWLTVPSSIKGESRPRGDTQEVVSWVEVKHISKSALTTHFVRFFFSFLFFFCHSTQGRKTHLARLL